jgi:hypothetical protein
MDSRDRKPSTVVTRRIDTEQIERDV